MCFIQSLAPGPPLLNKKLVYKLIMCTATHSENVLRFKKFKNEAGNVSFMFPD